jgi:hypothetical protein
VASFYDVVQYVADPVRNERINIGVLTYGDGRVRSLFLQNWQRVRQFAGRDVAFLRDIAHDAQKWDERAVKRLASQWTGSVQISEPSVSTLPPDELLVDAGFRYLVDRATAERGYRSKADVVKIVRKRIREKLVERLGAVGRAFLREKNYPLPGLHMPYEFDACVGNGHPIFAAQGLSFEVPETRRLDKDISATAWLIEDVKRITPDFPIGVVALRPKTPNGMYESAIRTFKELSAEIVAEEDLSSWATRMVDSVPAHGPQ